MRDRELLLFPGLPLTRTDASPGGGNRHFAGAVPAIREKWTFKEKIHSFLGGDDHI